MAKQSDDIRVLYRAFGHSDLPYHELTSQARYRHAVAKWPLLARCNPKSQTGCASARDHTEGSVKDSH